MPRTGLPESESPESVRMTLHARVGEISPAHTLSLGAVSKNADALPELWTCTFTSTAILDGRFAFAREAESQASANTPRHRRASGGHAVRVGPGVLYAAIALPKVNSLVADATSHNLLNRHVRPLLRALSFGKKPASYIGKDRLTIGSTAVAYCGFAFDASSGVAIVEAFIGVTESFAASDGDDAKVKDGSLASLSMTTLTIEELAEKVRRHAAREFGRELAITHASALSGAAPDAPFSGGLSPFATSPAAIGTIGFSRGDEGLFFGGDCMMAEEGETLIPRLLTGDPEVAFEETEALLAEAAVFGVSAKELVTLVEKAKSASR